MSVEPLTPAEIDGLSMYLHIYLRDYSSVDHAWRIHDAAFPDCRECAGQSGYWASRRHPLVNGQDLRDGAGRLIAAQSRELETLRDLLREIVENPDWDAPANPTTRAQFDRARSLLAASDPTDAEKAQFIADLALINENLDVEETTMFEFLADPSLPPVEQT